MNRKRRFGKGPPTLMLRFLFALFAIAVVAIFAVVYLINWALSVLFAILMWLIPIVLGLAVLAGLYFFIRGVVKGIRGRSKSPKTVVGG